MPLLNIVRNLILVFAYPFLVIMHTLVYEKLIWEVEYPGIRQKPRAA